jgi:plasmid maintenance system antidote protein VapI
VEFWLNLQHSYDKEIAEEKLTNLKKEIKPCKEGKENTRSNIKNARISQTQEI